MISQFFIFLIKLYRVLFAFKRPSCRFVPTCSSYAIESIKNHGACKGLWLAMKRIAKCHPLARNAFSFDPVPPASSGNHAWNICWKNFQVHKKDSKAKGISRIKGAKTS